MAARGEGLGQIVPDPFGVADVADREGGEADDGVHRGADVVRHIGQEVALCAAGGLGGRDRVRKRLIDLPVGRAVGQHEDVLGPACRLGAHGDDMEPAALAGLLMDIIRVPFALLAALKSLEEVRVAAGGVLFVQRREDVDVLPHLFERQTEQTLDVRADIVRVRGLAVQHEENVVDIVREPVEQLVPVQDVGILSSERGAAAAQDERDDQHREQDHDSDHDLDRSEPQPVHAGVDDADRDKAENGPVLNARALVDQIVPRPMQRQHPAAVPALCEVGAQRVELFPGQVGMLTQLREQVIDRVVAVGAAVEHDAPVRIDDIAVSRAAEGGIVERVQHHVVIVGDGDRVVGEAAVGSLRLRANKHEHLRLSGHHRVQHDVLAIGKRLVQVDLRAERAPFAVRRHAAAVRGEKVEGGAAGLLLHLVQAGADLLLAQVVFHTVVPQMQQRPVAADQMTQHIVGFMDKLGQMRGAFLIDRLRDERDVPEQTQPSITNRMSRAAAVLRQFCGRRYFVFLPRFLSVIPVYLSVI